MTQLRNIHELESKDPLTWPSDYVYIGRSGKGLGGYFGNPELLKNETDRTANVARYKKYFYERIKTDPEFLRRVLDLKGKVLICFCAPRLCHGCVIIEFLEGITVEKQLEELKKKKPPKPEREDLGDMFG